jgi:hypothetical protein
MADLQKELDALLNAWRKANGSVEEAVEVMTMTARHLRRKYADRQPWAVACYSEGEYLIGEYLIWLGNCIDYPQLRFCRKECNRLRRSLKQALRQKGPAASQLNGGLEIYVDLGSGVLGFSAVPSGVDTEFRLNRRRCRELIAVLAPANLDRLEREYEEEMNEL